MPSTAVLATVTAALVLAAGSSCQTTSSSGSTTSTTTNTTRSGGNTSSSVSCRNDVCDVEVAGDLSRTRLGVLGRELRILEIGDDAVTLTLQGAERRIAAGATESVAGLTVRVRDTGSGKASLEFRRG